MDSDGCQVTRRFLQKKTFSSLTQQTLFGFIINCTTQTAYKVEYSSGELCECGEYLVNKNGSHKSVFCRTFHLLQVNFTVEISVENIRSPEGERCTFSFSFSAGSTKKFDVRIEHGTASTPVPRPPSPTTSTVFPSSTTHETDVLSTGTLDTCYKYLKPLQ